MSYRIVSNIPTFPHIWILLIYRYIVARSVACRLIFVWFCLQGVLKDSFVVFRGSSPGQ